MKLLRLKKGTTVRLTIDRDVQWVAAQAIQEAVSKARASSGTVIVMDPKTVPYLGSRNCSNI